MKNQIKIIVSALAVAGFQAYGQLVANGGFETGDFTGWTWGGNTGATGVAGGGYAHSGSYGAYLGPVGSDGTLTQTIATTAGDAYNITFWHFGYNGTPNDFSVSFGGIVLLSYVNDTTQPTTYTQYTFTEVATSASSVLQFAFRNDPAYQGLDDVSVVDTGVASAPDFGPGFALTAVTLLGVCGFSRKLRRQMLAK
jgi:hypothetical protein